MILEGIVTTRNADGSVNIAPMGPILDPVQPDGLELARFTLRPFNTSTTHTNLARTRQGVLHVVDDVLLIARAAISALTEEVPTRSAESIDGSILEDCCRFHEFRIDQLEGDEPRVTMHAQVTRSGHVREFWGLNRAKHAVLECAILATRRHLIDRSELETEFQRLWIPIEKTGGPSEFEAYELLHRYVREGDAA